MARYSNTLQNQYLQPLVGASVYVYTTQGDLATLTADGGGALDNPVTTDDYGNFYFNTADGLYTIDVHYGGREIFKENYISVGTGPVLPPDVLAALLALLGANTGATLVGTSTGNNVQIELNNRPTSAALASGGAALLGFLQAGTGAIATTVQTEIRQDGLRPEQFGAVGNGVANDAPAIILALNQAIASGVPFTGTPGAIYGLGTAAWAGINLTLTGPLTIDMNGASFKLLVAPSQNAVFGAVHPFIMVDGTASNYPLIFKNCANVDFNLIRQPFLAPYRCSGKIFLNNFTNGDKHSGGIGDASTATYMNACNGLDIYLNRTRNVGYPIQTGQTGLNAYSQNCRIYANDFQQCYRASTPTERGDGVVGVLKNSQIFGNYFSGVFSGVAFAADGNNAGSFCEDCEATGNIIEDFVGHGIQTDVVNAGRNKNLDVSGNTINTGGAGAAALYLLHTDNLTAIGNKGLSVEYGCVIDDDVGFTVADNRFDATGSATPVGGLVCLAQLGTCSDGIFSGNSLIGFPDNIAIGGVGTTARIDVIGNKTKGGARGLHLQESAPGATTAIWVSGNDFAGSHGTFDVDNALTNGPSSVQWGVNRFATANGVAQVIQNAAPAPTAKTANATLTVAELLTSIVTSTSATAVALTFPTGTNTDAGVGAMAIGQSFDWNVINLGSASGAVTLTANTNHTLVGGATVAIGSQAQIRTRKTAANTFVSYRIG